MTEQILTDGGSLNQSSAPVVTQAPVAVSNEQPQEKMLRQSEVNELVKGAKLDAYKRAREDALAEAQKPQQNVSAPQTQPNSIGGIPQMSADEFRRVAQEEAQKHFAQQQQHFASSQMVHQFINKMEAGKQKYPDFESKVAQLQVDKIPQIIPLINQADNAEDVMYDLADPANAHKVSTILQNLRDPNTAHLAQMQMQALSQSIKANQAAKAQPSIEDPLSQLSHSTTSTDNGERTVGDIRRNPRYRV